MGAIVWVTACLAAIGLAFAAAVVLWPDKRRGPSVADIQRRLATEERSSI